MTPNILPAQSVTIGLGAEIGHREEVMRGAVNVGHCCGMAGETLEQNVMSDVLFMATKCIKKILSLSHK